MTSAPFETVDDYDAHLIARHDYMLSPGDLANAEPYALDQLHRGLHERREYLVPHKVDAL